MTTIEKIHMEVDTAQDRLLQKATTIVEMNKPSTEHEKKIEKAERLRKLGFTMAAPIYEAESLKEQNTFMVKTKEEADLILYYKKTYPFMKFLTDAELDRICSKYGLIYAPVSKYTGDIPEKNLRDIENAQKIKENDKRQTVFLNLNFYSGIPLPVREWFNNHEFKESEVLDSRGEILIDQVLKRLCPIEFTQTVFYGSGGNRIIRKGGDALYIAAPKSLFNLKGLKKYGLGYFIGHSVKKDPIVFRYVKGGILVLTKWGIEAEDKLLQNEIDN